MSEKVNLDAFILREDFEYQENPCQSTNITTIGVRDLEISAFFYNVLRKPDFQRETNEWEPERVCELIESFVNGELIPAIILWKNPGNYVFILDGAHRISALLAWINDDYGNGTISTDFYEGDIPKRQAEQALATQKLVDSRVGKYKQYQIGIRNSSKVSPEIARRAKNLAFLAIQLQWVEGDADKAESSFKKINKKATPIDTTEMKLIEGRKKPNVLAARAIVRGGKGNNYWASFADTTQADIQKLGKSINALLFQPELNTPVKTLDLPIAGKTPTSRSLALTFEFVNIVNNIDPRALLDDDEDGTKTIEYLNACKKMAQRINSTHPSSLGLHPAVYFYSSNGSHKPTSFYAIVSLIMYLETKNLFAKFIDIRSKFEDILIKYSYLIQQIGRKYRDSAKAYGNIREFYLHIIDKLLEGKDTETIIREIIKDKHFNYLTIEYNTENIISQDFSERAKSSIFMTEALSYALRCKLCNGYIHQNSITFDHIIRKADGGIGDPENGQIAHPYCNTVIKK